MINHFVVFLISNDAPYHQLAYVLAPPGTTRNQYHDKYDITMINIHIIYVFSSMGEHTREVNALKFAAYSWLVHLAPLVGAGASAW